MRRKPKCGRTDRQTDRHGDSSIPPYLRCGGIIISVYYIAELEGWGVVSSFWVMHTGQVCAL